MPMISTPAPSSCVSSHSDSSWIDTPGRLGAPRDRQCVGSWPPRAAPSRGDRNGRGRRASGRTRTRPLAALGDVGLPNHGSKRMTLPPGVRSSTQEWPYQVKLPLASVMVGTSLCFSCGLSRIALLARRIRVPVSDSGHHRPVGAECVAPLRDRQRGRARGCAALGQGNATALHRRARRRTRTGTSATRMATSAGRVTSGQRGGLAALARRPNVAFPRRGAAARRRARSRHPLDRPAPVPGQPRLPPGQAPCPFHGSLLPARRSGVASRQRHATRRGSSWTLLPLIFFVLGAVCVIAALSVTIVPEQRAHQLVLERERSGWGAANRQRQTIACQTSGTHSGAP